jgi:Arc/MetJ-type ribon-helix-helix transcriptional regulator
MHTQKPAFDKPASPLQTTSVKTESVNVSLPAELAEFARQDMSLGTYGTLNEYVRDLLRKRRQERIQEDVRSLEKAGQGAPAEDPGEAFYGRVATLQKEVRCGKKCRA